MDNIFLLKKICVAVGELFVSPKYSPDRQLIMTILAKNEEDILEENILFHKAMGVDGFIVTDNDSTDRTPEIIEKYKKKGWIIESLVEKGKDHRQKEWVDRMIWLAKTKYHADWIINADADEFWFPLSGNLKETLLSQSASELLCPMVCMYPERDIPLTSWNKTVKVVQDVERYGLSVYSVFARQIPKAAHRTRGYIQVSSGNHKVAMFPKRKRTCDDICIYHYNIRGESHFLRKMVDGGKALEQNPSKHGGRHWRYFYELYKEGRLKEEYKRVIGETSYGCLLHDGYIVEDNTMKTFFDRLYKEM